MPTVSCQICQKVVSLTRAEGRYLLDVDSFLCDQACLLDAIQRCKPSGRCDWMLVPACEEDYSVKTYSKKFDMWFRSVYEIEVAEWLTLNGIDWEYECVYYDVAGQVCIPDFRLPDYGVILEVKGLWMQGSRRKILGLRELYPHEHVIVADWTLHDSIKKALNNGV